MLSNLKSPALYMQAAFRAQNPYSWTDNKGNHFRKERAYVFDFAPERTLILFDELGRGTATYDGMALAQSIIEYIHEHIRSQDLFATHYHELTSLESKPGTT